MLRLLDTSFESRFCFALSIGLLIVAASLPGRADDKAEARRHFENGLALSSDEIKDYAGAVVEFEVSVKLYPTMAGLFNLALCYKRLSRYGEALQALRRLQQEFTDSMDDDLHLEVAREVEAIQRITAELVLEVEPPGARIRLDGDSVGFAPLAEPLVLGPREYLIEVEKPGYESEERKLRLVSGQRHTEQIKLSPTRASIMVEVGDVDGAAISLDGEEVGRTPLAEPLEIDPGAYVVEVAKEGYESAAPQTVKLVSGEKATLSFLLTPVAAEEATEEDTGPRPSALFWTGLGLTVASGVTGGVFFGLAGNAHDDFENYNDQASGVLPGTTDAAMLLSKREDAKADVNLYSKLGWGFCVGAGVLALTSAVILMLDLQEDEEQGDSQEPDEIGVAAVPNGFVVVY